MASIESEFQSFVIRVWYEETGEYPRSGFWRGHITYLPEGSRYYFQDLAEISTHIHRTLKQEQPLHHQNYLHRFVQYVKEIWCG